MNSNEQIVHIPRTDGSLASVDRDDFQLRKWRGAAKGGFQVVPNVLFRAQKHLGLDCVDIVILLNLTLHWWKVDNLPFPSPAIVANRMGVSKRTVERRIKALERRKFLIRLPPEQSAAEGPPRRRYVLSGFIQKLEVLAENDLNRREFQRRAERRRYEGYEE